MSSTFFICGAPSLDEQLCKMIELARSVAAIFLDNDSASIRFLLIFEN
jgi:hypothetical protein